MRHINVTLRGLVLAAVGLLLTLGVVALLDDSQAEPAAVRKHLTAIPNVRVTYISDPTKQASECITAYVEVVGKGAIGFNGLNTRSFGHSSRIRLHGIGLYGFRTRELVKGQEAYGYNIDVGASSPIPAARQLGITSVQSAIAHHDELLAIVAHWPVTTNDWPHHWPAKSGEWSNTSDEEVHFPDLPRGDYYFRLKRAGDGDEQMWPPNYPKASE